jgi:hypothetical protein
MVECSEAQPHSVAVNQVLLGQGHKLSGLHKDRALNISDGRESPAAAAAALVLDGGDGTFGAPVDAVIGSTKAAHGGVGALALEGATRLEAELLGAEFILREISEFVDAVTAKELEGTCEQSIMRCPHVALESCWLREAILAKLALKMASRSSCSEPT